MWVIDIRHWLNEQQDGPAAPQLRHKVKKLAEIIIWITLRDRGLLAGETRNARDGRWPDRRLAGVDMGYERGDDSLIWWVYDSALVGK
jgi:hypothetical protein